jgi:hypothetical protein
MGSTKPPINRYWGFLPWDKATKDMKITQLHQLPRLLAHHLHSVSLQAEVLACPNPQTLNHLSFIH